MSGKRKEKQIIMRHYSWIKFMYALSVTEGGISHIVWYHTSAGLWESKIKKSTLQVQAHHQLEFEMKLFTNLTFLFAHSH